MPIRNVDAATVQRAVQQDYGDAALGRVGNLRFRGSPGATPRARRPNIFKRMAASLSAMVVSIRQTPQQRAQTEALAAAREFSRNTGSLLGALTANGDTGKDKRAVVAALKRMQVDVEKLSAGGTPSELLGPVLRRHTRALSDVDLQALRNGILSKSWVRQEIAQTLTPLVRSEAQVWLDTIEQNVVDEHAARAGEAFCKVFLPAISRRNKIDGGKLDDALRALTIAADSLDFTKYPSEDFATRAMQRVPNKELGALVRALSSRRDGDSKTAFEDMKTIVREHCQNEASSYIPLLEDMQKAVYQTAGARLDDEVQRQGSAMKDGIAQGHDAQMVYDMAQREVAKLGGRELGLGDLADEVAVSRAMAAAGQETAERLITKLDYVQLAAIAKAAAQLGPDEAGIVQPIVQNAYDVLADEFHAGVDLALSNLEWAASEGNRGLAAEALRALSGAVNASRIFHDTFGETMDGARRDALCAAVSGAQALFRAADDRDGPLSEASLRELTHRELGHLRAASDELTEFGLDFYARAMKSEVTLRGNALMQPLHRPITDLVTLLAGDADIATLMRAVRDVAGQAADGMDKLSVFGTGMGGDDRVQALDSVIESTIAKMAGNDDILRNAARYIGPRLGSANQVLQEVKMALAHQGFEHTQDADTVREYVTSAADGQIALLDMASTLLTALASALNGPANIQGQAQSPVVVSPELVAVLRTEFGMDYEPVSGEARMTLARAAREKLDAELALPASKDTWPNQTIELSNGTRMQSFTVSHQFVLDAIERPSVTFSVLGQDKQNRPISESSLVGKLVGSKREQAVARSLDALQRVAGEVTTEKLTHIMNQQIAGALLTGLDTIGTDSPLQLPDGTTAIPTGPGYMHFDVEGLADGRFALDVRMHIPELGVASILLPEGMRDGVPLDPTGSDVIVTFGLLVAVDAQAMEVAKPVQMRYRFLPA
ncbi:hypothetical protein [Bordetella sp. BOR01]|uniref:hypothetical protein n=1 Tax=Bordetella sp. BOR01 TaxID=2854779 RepID=UPI001C494A97|nr:hypothetical protein [Bordetella sp. BOR01]MBV7485220.1 hypothetical protein [Bordetella sp. BOR01]